MYKMYGTKCMAALASWHNFTVKEELCATQQVLHWHIHMHCIGMCGTYICSLQIYNACIKKAYHQKFLSVYFLHTTQDIHKHHIEGITYSNKCSSIVLLLPLLLPIVLPSRASRAIPARINECCVKSDYFNIPQA